ncbi:MAG: hypothetical protein BRD55_02475 [Bacteroidetes bacterium SW_9_63_38]|nr:MAG: hypothetical protein BRD55_02475 [Bacteroidetes bacterium SW_9_63_38]
MSGRAAVAVVLGRDGQPNSLALGIREHAVVNGRIGVQIDLGDGRGFVRRLPDEIGNETVLLCCLVANLFGVIRVGRSSGSHETYAKWVCRE